MDIHYNVVIGGGIQSRTGKLPINSYNLQLKQIKLLLNASYAVENLTRNALLLTIGPAIL